MGSSNRLFVDNGHPRVTEPRKFGEIKPS